MMNIEKDVLLAILDAYEIISGHRRHHACGRAGLTAIPCVVRDVDYDTAVILMVDSNIQRENTSISEKAKVIKMKYEAIKRQGVHTDLTSPKISAKLRSDDEIGRQMGMSGDSVRNYMALTELVPELTQMMDDITSSLKDRKGEDEGRKE